MPANCRSATLDPVKFHKNATHLLFELLRPNFRGEGRAKIALFFRRKFDHRPRPLDDIPILPFLKITIKSFPALVGNTEISPKHSPVFSLIQALSQILKIKKDFAQVGFGGRSPLPEARPCERMAKRDTRVSLIHLLLQ